MRARSILDLSEALASQVANAGGTDLLHELELPLVQVLADMEATGVAVDEPGLRSLEADFDADRALARPVDRVEPLGREIAGPGGVV